jgi:hypothetical protein
MITRAAVKIKDIRQNKEIIIPVHRHCDAFYILKEFGYKLNKDYNILQQGFLNEHDEFMTRIQAYNEACNCNQIVPKTNLPTELFSEDLY